MLIDNSWIDAGARGGLLAVIALCWIVVLIRLNGLRSLSKMTNFDFVMTIALGSLVASASQSREWTAFFQTLVAMAALFLVQWLAARLRKVSDAFEQMSQNTPVVLMRDGSFIDDALEHTRVSRSDIVAKLREANVLDLSQVRAVVLETTGDVSVLHGSKLDETLLQDVKRA